MPEELITAVREYAGVNRFSEYVSSAVAKRLRLELLGELIAEYEAIYGPVPQELLDQAAREWPDYEPDDQEDEVAAG